MCSVAGTSFPGVFNKRHFRQKMLSCDSVLSADSGNIWSSDASGLSSILELTFL